MSDIDTEQYGPIKFAAENASEIRCWFLFGAFTAATPALAILAGIASKGMNTHGTIGLALGVCSTVSLVAALVFVYAGKAARDKRKKVANGEQENLIRRVRGETSDNLHIEFDKERAEFAKERVTLSEALSEARSQIVEWKEEIKRLREEAEQRRAEIIRVSQERDRIGAELQKEVVARQSLAMQLQQIQSDDTVAKVDALTRYMDMWGKMIR